MTFRNAQDIRVNIVLRIMQHNNQLLGHLFFYRLWINQIELISTHWHKLWHSIVVNRCVVNSVKPHNHLTSKPNVIWKLGNKVKYISQINRGLIMSFLKFENIFKISWLDCDQWKESIGTRRRTQLTVQYSRALW